MSKLGLSVALASFAADQAFKACVLYVYRLAERGRVEVTPFFDLVLTWNKGISYGLLKQGGMGGQYLLAGFKIIVALALIVWLARVGDRLVALGLGLIIGGALGNALDRLLYGGVADFFSLHFRDFYWYIFNVADIAIVAGVGLLLLDSFFMSRETTKSRSKS